VWETIELNGLKISAVPAMDWRGDNQVSWVVDVAGEKIFHGGDTIWHGYIWKTFDRFGPMSAVLLPVNGVLTRFKNLDPSGLPATLTPQQAVIATRLLKGEFLCPIHYHTFNNPPFYSERANIEEELRSSAAREGVSVHLIPEGDPIV
jgi:L-ascorbate metabolism protein UlaG (beta-lactamase superfamily)